MCGIAGIIYRDGGGERHVGRDMTLMLQAMKHRGPDSTGYALYRSAADSYVMHVKLAESNGHRDFDFEARLRRQRHDVESRVRELGARIHAVTPATEHAMTMMATSSALPTTSRTCAVWRCCRSGARSRS
jgi:methylamine---glutamate N-methyltransferase subunit A